MASTTSGCKPEQDEHRCPSVSARTSTASNVRRFSSGVKGLSSMISRRAPIASVLQSPHDRRRFEKGLVRSVDYRLFAYFVSADYADKVSGPGWTAGGIRHAALTRAIAVITPIP